MKELKSSEALEDFVMDLVYPLTKDELLQQARIAPLDADAVVALEKIPEGRYAQARDVADALNETR